MRNGLYSNECALLHSGQTDNFHPILSRTYLTLTENDLLEPLPVFSPHSLRINNQRVLAWNEVTNLTKKSIKAKHICITVQPIKKKSLIIRAINLQLRWSRAYIVLCSFNSDECYCQLRRCSSPRPLESKLASKKKIAAAIWDDTSFHTHWNPNIPLSGSVLRSVRTTLITLLIGIKINTRKMLLTIRRHCIPCSLYWKQTDAKKRVAGSSPFNVHWNKKILLVWGVFTTNLDITPLHIHLNENILIQ